MLALIRAIHDELKGACGSPRMVLELREQMTVTAFEYIEVFYNRKRLHSMLGYKSPALFLQDWLVAQQMDKQVA